MKLLKRPAGNRIDSAILTLTTFLSDEFISFKLRSEIYACTYKIILLITKNNYHICCIW